MERKTIMIDMDEVITRPRFSEFIDEFLGGVDFEKLDGYYRQDLIKGREEEYKKIYKNKSLYHKDDGTFVDPIEGCAETIEKLNKYYDVYVVTTYVWKEDVVDAAYNLKYKFDYLHHFLPFLDPNRFVFMTEKTKLKFDIGIDDRPSNLLNCDMKLLFTEFRNEKLSKQELDEKGLIRVDDWKAVERLLLQNV